MEERFLGTNPGHLFWQAIRVVYEDLFILVFLSTLTWLGLMLVVPFFPAFAALHEVAVVALEGRSIRTGLFWQYLRARFGKALLLGLIMTVLTAVLMVNVRFYSQHPWQVLRYLAVFWLWVLLIWAMAAMYIFPLLALQEDTRLVILVRNALFLTLGRPLQTLGGFILLLVAVVVTTVLPIFLLVLPALWAVYTTLLAQQLVLSIQHQYKGEDGGEQGEKK